MLGQERSGEGRRGRRGATGPRLLALPSPVARPSPLWTLRLSETEPFSPEAETEQDAVVYAPMSPTCLLSVDKL